MSLRDQGAIILATAGLVGGLLAGASASAQTTTLDSSDFTLVMSRLDSSGNFIPLDDNQRADFFTQARCSCPANYGVTLALTDAGAAALATTDALQAQIMIGSACDSVSAAGCPSFGSILTLTASSTSASIALPTSDVFNTLASGVACSALPASSSFLWAIVRLNGALLTSQPSLSISLGGAGPTAPTGVATETADSGLLVSWTEPTTTTALSGYQVLCSPGPSSPPAAQYNNCAAALPGGSGPFATLDPSLVCSGLVGVGTSSVRVKGLTNGTTYQIAVVSVGSDGTASAPSDPAQGTPGPTLGFDDVYKKAGGTGAAGCAIGGGGSPTGGAGLILVVSLVLVWRRRRAAAPSLGVVVAALVLFAGERVARAEFSEDGGGSSPRFGLALGGEERTVTESPREWNLELRFGPYYPDTDSEFADRGQPARPFAEVFGTSKKLMSGLEIDRHLSRRGGTWAIGVGVGYYSVSAAALSADQTARTGDQTSLRLIPLTVLAVYRADILRSRFGSPVIPYAKLGLGCGVWSLSDTSKSSATVGTTFGWDAAAGVSLDLSFIDREDFRTMDQESGINAFSIFFEVTHLGLDGFGSSTALRVGDTTWLGGLMMEM